MKIALVLSLTLGLHGTAFAVEAHAQKGHRAPADTGSPVGKTCEENSDCVGPAEEKCSMIQSDNTRCFGTAALRFECNAVDGVGRIKKCQKIISPCEKCEVPSEQ